MSRRRPPPPGSTAPGAGQQLWASATRPAAAPRVSAARPGGIWRDRHRGRPGRAGSRRRAPAGLGSGDFRRAERRAAAAETPATEPLSTETGGGAGANENRIRIIANRTNNALLVYATPDEYAVIEGMLHKIDIVPLQVLIEATIAEVDLNDQLQYGTQFFFKTDHVAETLGHSSINQQLPVDPWDQQPDFPSTSPLFHPEQRAEFRAGGARPGDQGQGLVGARGHGPRQPAGAPAGRPAGAGSDRDRDQHAGRGRAGRQQRRLS